MLIKELVINNFRQFYGEQKIEFALGDKNTTLIQGNNGAGKTSIYRALMFVLYGDESLKQDNSIKDLNLVNLDLLEENLGKPVKASVNLKFEQDNMEYILDREITANKSEEGKITKKVFEPKLQHIESTGDLRESFSSADQVQRYINSIVAPEIREFFFYDAEEMNLLDPESTEKSIAEDIKKGVMNILQIEYLEKSVDQIKIEISNLNKQLRDKNKNDEELNNLQGMIKDYEERIEKYDIKLSKLSEERKQMKEEKEHINNVLGDSEEKKYQISIIEKNAELISEKENLIKEKKKSITKQIIDCSILYGMDLVYKNRANFESILEKSPDIIPVHMLQKAISDGKCLMCSNEIKENSTEYIYIGRLIKEYKSSEMTGIVDSILETESKYADKEKILKSINETISDIVKRKEEIKEKRLENEAIREKYLIDINDSEKIKKLTDSLNNIEIDIESNEINISNAISVKDRDLEQLEKFKKKLSKLEEEKYKDLEIANTKEKLEEIKKAIEITIDEYSELMVNDLSEEIGKTFRKLIDEENLYFDKVEISDKFRISVKDINGDNIIQDLSAGQKQLLSLSFVLSLAKLATKGVEGIEFPLFMDTPFARLSSENRENVIKNIPEMADQWILLLTDTEYTANEKNIFSHFEKVGKMYSLNKVSGKTEISEREVY
ncbi:AAA family ATPase [Lagierella massiliensis]|uniref:AAA family ATPase n=1 Tax=Lagierella massiliensis TaxID=1689303 RepID=UPI0006D7918C|nr:AAA family ATPase [Lagierella massiliensis]